MSEMQAIKLPDEIVGEFMRKLRKIPGAFDYSGECSSQVAFRLQNGMMLRFGCTDDDVAEHPGCLWFDTYGGLATGDRHDHKTFEQGL